MTDDARVELSEDLVRGHQAALWRYLRALGCRAATAEDLVHDAFLALHRAGLRATDHAGVRAWLRATARNLYLAQVRRDRRAPVLGSELTGGTDHPTHGADLDAAFAAYERDDDGAAYRDALRGCIAALSERERRIVELRYEGGADRAALAAAAGVTVEGAKTLLRRIKLQLRHCITRQLSHERDPQRR